MLSSVKNNDCEAVNRNVLTALPIASRNVAMVDNSQLPYSSKVR